MKKVGIIGFGKMGQLRYKIIKKLSIFEIVSIIFQKFTDEEIIILDTIKYLKL